MVKAYLGKTGTVLFSMACCIFATLNCIAELKGIAPLSAIYLSRDLGYVWLAMAIITFLCAIIAYKEGMKGRQELLIWYHFTCIEFALFTLGVLFAYIIIGYKKHYEVRPGPYILYGVGFVLEVALIRHTWPIRRE